MKRIICFILAGWVLSSTSVLAQEVWDPNTSPTATHKAYSGVLFDLQNTRNNGSVFSVGLEYGRILNRNICLGVSGRFLWYGTSSNRGTAFGVNPYVRITTSFHRYIPNLFADIGYNFRRRTYDDSSMAPRYSHDFGIRPGLMVDVAGWFYLFIQFSFTGYQWSRAGEEISSSWTFFRHEELDRCAGVFFYF